MHDANERLAKNFWRSEFACPESGIGTVDWLLLERLQECRDYFNKKTVVTSGYRSELHNRRVGGSSDSYHRYGQAADHYIIDVPLRDVFAWWLHNYPDSGLSIYEDEGFIHADVRGFKARW